MTQKIFDIDSEEDMALLWNILTDGLELIAEYPTWQEAVNSKEFKGE